MIGVDRDTRDTTRVRSVVTCDLCDVRPVRVTSIVCDIFLFSHLFPVFLLFFIYPSLLFFIPGSLVSFFKHAYSHIHIFILRTSQ